MVVNRINRIVRRLTAAEGYLELDLPVDALAELQKVENPGPCEGPYMWLTGEALRNQGLYDEAIAPLRHAARALPQENGQQAWAALKECLEKSGRSATADDMTQTMDYLEKRSDTIGQRTNRVDAASNIRINIPQAGNQHLNFDKNQGLMIKVNPPDGDLV